MPGNIQSHCNRPCRAEPCAKPAPGTLVLITPGIGNLLSIPGEDLGIASGQAG